MSFFKSCFYVFLIVLFTSSASAFEYTVSDNKQIYGNLKSYKVQHGESLIDLSVKFGIGFKNLQMANQNKDTWLPKAEENIVLPTSLILPKYSGNGILINLGEKRLFYFYKNGKIRKVIVFPVGIGKEGKETPLGNMTITNKVHNPTWIPPQSIKKQYPTLPNIVPSGETNPLGYYWLQLSRQSYGIHGTNQPRGVGRRVSSGCIRLYNPHIKNLYNRIKPGTPVKIINKPVKVAFERGRVYLESHTEFKSNTDIKSLQNLLDKAIVELKKASLCTSVSAKKLFREIIFSSGYPVDISGRNTSSDKYKSCLSENPYKYMDTITNEYYDYIFGDVR